LRLAQLLGRDLGDERQHARILGEPEQILDLVEQVIARFGLLRIADEVRQESPDLRLAETVQLDQPVATDLLGPLCQLQAHVLISQEVLWLLVTTTFASPCTAASTVSKCSSARS